MLLAFQDLNQRESIIPAGLRSCLCVSVSNPPKSQSSPSVWRSLSTCNNKQRVGYGHQIPTWYFMTSVMPFVTCSNPQVVGCWSPIRMKVCLCDEYLSFAAVWYSPPFTSHSIIYIRCCGFEYWACSLVLVHSLISQLLRALVFPSLTALPVFPLGSSLPCWRLSPPPTSSSHGRWRRHAQWAVRHAAARWPAGRWGENNTRT